MGRQLQLALGWRDGGRSDLVHPCNERLEAGEIVGLQFRTMPTDWAYVSVKVSDDDVASAVKEAKDKAIDKLGSKEIELYEKAWGTPDYLCTIWRLVTPDPPQPPNP